LFLRNLCSSDLATEQKLLCIYLLCSAKMIFHLIPLTIVQVANGNEKGADWKAWFAEQIKRDEEIK